jgi:transitional endoplasmic reticulum ATPase
VSRKPGTLNVPPDIPLRDGARLLLRVAEDLDREESRSRVLRCRPLDLAAAVDRVFRATFGGILFNGGMGLFGPTPPRFIETPTDAHGGTMSVPMGEISVPGLDRCSWLIGVEQDPDLGSLGRIDYTCRREDLGAVNALILQIEASAQEQSIYRGKAITAADFPVFVDLAIDPTSVVYPQETLRQLDACLWSPIRYAAETEALGMHVRRSVLLYGDYGCGKTLAGILTARIAAEAGWTFVLVKPGEDFSAALRTARVYSPAVVFAEDLDAVSQGADSLSGLLDAFDGAISKGSRVMAVLTTNHPERLPQGLLRPGRLDAIIRIPAPDTAAIVQLLDRLLPVELPAEDLVSVAEAMHGEGFTGAFIAEATTRAIRYALARDPSDIKVSTLDLLDSVASMAEHSAMMADASETGTRAAPTLDRAMAEAIASGIRERFPS